MAERILVLEGPKGTAIQALELSEEDFRGDLLKDHPRDIRGDNDVLGLTRPDIVEAIHRDYLAAGAWILSTNTFNASPVSQAEYGLEHLVYDMNRAAAENARRALDGAEDRFVVGSVGPDEPHALDLPQGRGPRVPDDHVRPADGGLRGADPRARRRRRRRAPDRDDLRHAEREGGDRRRPGRRPGRAALALLHRGRPERPEPLGTDRGGVLALDRARGADDRRRQLLARRRADAPLPRGALPDRPHLHGVLPQRGAPQRDGPPRRRPRDHERLRRRVRARRTRQRPRWLLRDHAGAHPADRGGRPRPASAAGPRPRRDVHLVQRTRAVRRPARHGVRDGGRTPEHHGLEEVPASDRERRLPGGRRHRAGAGPERREPARREHGHRPARRAARR